MARKGNQQKNGLDRRASSQKKRSSDPGTVPSEKKNCEKVSEACTFPREDHQSNFHAESTSKMNYVRDDSDRKEKSEKFAKEKQGMDSMLGPEQLGNSGSNTGHCIENTSSAEPSVIREESGTLPSNNHGSNWTKNILSSSMDGFQIKNLIENADLSYNAAVRSLRTSALSILRTADEWFETHKPSFIRFQTNILKTRDYVSVKVRQAYPIVRKFFMHLGNIMLLLSVLWLDCALRGLDSLLRMGMTSFFSVVWCSILSVIAMVGMSKFLMVLGIAVLVGVFIRLTLAIVAIAIFGTVFLWIYGSFWTTAIVIFFGGLAFALSYERLALFITTLYSVYSAWMYVGWLGLLFGLNLSFFSSDALMYFLKNNISQQREPEQSAEFQGQPGFTKGDPMHASSSENGPGLYADRSSGVPSTSGVDADISSEDEVIRLLNCIDHYSALGFSRYENVDVSVLKREYRKKAMLVHPDKNMGNEKAVEAFKKLQNAYEVLLDSLKRKLYDDELRREEFLDYFRRFQSASRKNGKHGFFGSGFTCSDGDGEDPFGESRRIACKKCGNFHIWVHTKKSKSQARWCQDCKEFHQAKDGDGWVEQSSRPFFFGLIQKVDSPCAYVCADGKIYNASQWYICQGMRCQANTHKPSFHVNASLTSKNNSAKGTSSGQRGARMPNMEGSMTEEEFYEWLQSAVQSGIFENSGGGNPTDSPSARGGKGSNSSPSNAGNSKKKKKGKKPW